MSDIFEDILSSAEEETDKAYKPSDKTVYDETEKNKWNHIKGSLRYQYKPIEKWNGRDFTFYFQQAFKDEFGEYLEVSLPAECQSMLLLQDKMKEFFGKRASKRFVKEYIDWFIANRARKIIVRYKCFQTKFLRKDYNFEDFLNYYRQKQNIINQEHRELKDNSILNSDALLLDYKANKNVFLLKYGLVLTALWLHRKEGLSERQIIDAITKQVRKILDKDQSQYAKIIESTEKYSPYAPWCELDIFNELFSELSKQTGCFFDIIDIDFSVESQNYYFLKE